MRHDMIFKYIDDMCNCEIKAKIEIGDHEFDVKGGLIAKCIEYKKIQYKNGNRILYAIYFNAWYSKICCIPPYPKYYEIYFDIKDSIEKTVRRYLSSYGKKSKFNPETICKNTEIPLTRANLKSVQQVLNNL